VTTRVGRRPLGLELIAAFKFVKAAALFAAGCVALKLVNPERAGWVQGWLEGLSLDQGHRLVAVLAGHALGMMDLGGPQRFSHFAAGAFLLACLFVVEGVGLALARRWAEYMTVAVTTSFLPIEVASSWHRWSLPRAGTVVLNLGVVVYLIVQIRTDSRAPRPG
jgi:uncharacterized membrane protein (DUF2068 family)